MSGAALVAVLGVVALLGVIVFVAAQFLVADAEARSAQQLSFRAEQLADMGIALAAHPDVERWDPLLRQQVSDSDAYSARIESEAARLDLNRFLAPERRFVLENLFEIWGASREQAVSVTDALVDWADRDERPTGLEGGELPRYASQGIVGLPLNRPFRELQELPLVRGWNGVAALRPDWRNAFSLRAGGQLDLNEAAPDLIRAVTGAGEDVTRRFVLARLGPDGRFGTEDDLRFESVEQALELLQVGDEDPRIPGLVRVSGGPVRLVAVGSTGGVALEKTVLLQARERQPVVLAVHSRRLARGTTGRGGGL